MSNIYAPTDPKALHAKIVSLLGINVANLQLHRDFLYNNSDVIANHFDMRQFCQFSEELDDKFGGQGLDEIDIVKELGLDIDCGSSMCVVGWAPSNPALKEQINALTNDYGDRWLNIASLFIDRSRDVSLFDYMFGQHWTNDLSAAIERIDLVIEAATDASYDNAVILAALANSDCRQRDRSISLPDYLEEQMDHEWIESVVTDVPAYDGY